MNRSAAAAVFVAALSVVLAAQASQERRITASAASISLPAAGSTEAMIFVTLENATMYDVFVQSVKADVANKAELRDAGSDTPSKPLEFVTVPNHDTVYMGPKGVHIALVGLKRPLMEGETITLTLTTETGDSLQVAAVVRKP